MTHAPHFFTVSLNYTKQPGEICRSYKRNQQNKVGIFFDSVIFGILGNFAGYGNAEGSFFFL